MLSIVFKGKPTHHKIIQGEGGTFTVNTKPMGDATDLESLIAHLR